MQLQDLKEIASSTHNGNRKVLSYLGPECECLLPFLPDNGARKVLAVHSWRGVDVGGLMAGDGRDGVS